MRNIFLLYMPPGNPEAMAHYRDTIQQRVPLSRLARHLNRSDVEWLRRLFGEKPIAVWGSRDGVSNRTKFDRMREGDDLLIVEGATIKLLGKVAFKVISSDLSRELWKDFRDTGQGWDLIYFIANPLEIGVPFEEFRKLVGYASGFQLRGFSAVADDRLAEFYDHYDDLYSILVRIREGRVVEPKPTPPLPELAPAALVPLEADDDDVALAARTISEHVRMQWLLASLGLKAGEKIWVPAADQGKLRQQYEFNEFEREFASGIDLPKSYIENIDVVWKEQFRIDAAFEIENSTAIYSGLLRFADLSILAPNTVYPMFIVAPAERRSRVRDQLMRPTFGQLNLREKVRFLPYEVVDDIDRFFRNSSRGLSVDLLKGKAEVLT